MELNQHLNGAVAALAAGEVVFASFAPADTGNAQAMAAGPYDVVVFEMEHNPFDVSALRTSLQFLLDRRAIAAQGDVRPQVTPFVRIPANGSEMTQWLAKQVLDAGVYGVIWPHVSTSARRTTPSLRAGTRVRRRRRRTSRPECAAMARSAPPGTGESTSVSTTGAPIPGRSRRTATSSP
jgi:citrate lyase beta subunit